MRRPHLAALVSVAALCFSALALAPSASAAPGGQSAGHRNVHVCAGTTSGLAACSAIRREVVTSSGKAAPLATTVPPGAKTPADIRSAYGLDSNDATAKPAHSGGKTVAIVDAYNAPTAEADLAVYRKQFGLSECTTANSCFRKVSQTGSTRSLPRNNGGWAQEISLDIDMVSATCPDCKILLVEANSATFNDLATAVKYAASQPGVIAISNSYGGTDLSGSGALGAAFNQPGIAVTASSGDGGFGIQSPASFSTVIAVGGTSLSGSISEGWSESAWGGAGSGCSTLNANPGWQVGTGCEGKATADISAVADPNTGVAVYDSFAFQGFSGWLQFGGTSVSSPIIASVYAQGTAATGRPSPALLKADSPGSTYPGAVTWSRAGGHRELLHDVISGSNGPCGAPLCVAGAGWDGPTGLGTPSGTGAF